MDGRNSTGARVSLLNDSPIEQGDRRRVEERPAFESKASYWQHLPYPHQSSITSSASHSHSSAHQQLQRQPSHSHSHQSAAAAASDRYRRPQLRQTTSLAATHSRTSSFASTPVLSSPSTPQLVRSDSSDSAMMNRSPSPVTPVGLGFDALAVSQAQDPHGPFAANQFAPPSFFAPNPAAVAQKAPPSHYPPIGQHHALPFAYPQHPQSSQIVFPTAAVPSLSLQPVQPQAPSSQQQQQQQLQPQLLPGSPSTNSSSAPVAAKAQSKKNHYPCPLAKEFSCNNFFTTSGHAARHAKKHTGKKDAFCPECNKAFTRKDNMEQHRRTHQNGRNTAKSTNGEAPAKRQKTSSSSSSQSKRARPTPLEDPVPVIDPSLPVSPASSFGFSDPAGLGLSVQPAPQVYPADLLQQGAFPPAMPYPSVPYFDSSSMSGLDKLAMAASGESSRQNSGSL